MAKKFKKLFAMLLVMSMLFSMLPVQALAEEPETPAVEDLDVTVTADEETNEIVIDFTPSDAAVEASENAAEEPAAEEPAAEEPAAEEPAAEEPAAEEAEQTEEIAVASEEVAVASEEEVVAENPDSVMDVVDTKLSIDSENNVVVDYAPAGEQEITSDLPEGQLDWESELTQGEDITTEVTDVVVKEEVLEDGTQVETESVTLETEGTLENGAVIEGEETYTETTSTATDNSVRVEGVVEGSETVTEEQETDINVEIDVPMTDEDDPETTDIIENQNTVLGDKVGTVIEGTEAPEILPEGDYEYTWTEVVEQGSVTVTTEEIEIREDVDVKNTDLEHVVSTTTPTEDNDLVYSYQAPDMYLPGYEGEIVVPEESLDDDYAFTYVGAGNTSKFMPSIVYTEPLDEEGKLAMYGENAYIKKNSITYYYVGWLTEEVKATIAKDENGNYVTDENGYILDVNGNRIFKEERTSVDPEGNTVYLHRFDNYGKTMYAEGWYENGEWVEELNGDKSFAAIWAGPQQFILVDDEGNLVTAYCADVSTPTQDNFGYNIENLEDATYYSEEEAAHIRAIASNGYWGDDGNLEEMRAKLAEAGFSAEELASLNDGVALTATQMAIWSYSNKMSSIEFINSYYSNWGVGDVPADKEDEVKLMFKLYDYLTNLDAVEVEGTTADTIINADNFVDNINITVIEKAEGHANNADADDTNDAYKTNLTFALVVKPSNENGDDLVVEVVDAHGNVIASGRVAGKLQEGEKMVTHYGDNNYGFEGIVLTEGNQTFSLNLKGVQYLKEGVYLYSSEVVDGESSQTLVGVASGKRSVNVSMDITFKLDVKDQVVATERVWRRAEDPVDTPPPTRYRYVPAGETTIEEEPVPLAEVPQTGDNSVIWFAMITLAAAGLFIINASEKKCKA